MIKKMYSREEIKMINKSLELMKNIEWVLENMELNEVVKKTLKKLQLDILDEAFSWAAPSSV